MGAGRISIVGAGPGAADLITVRGRRLLRAADLVVVDSLVPQSFLSELEIPATGKRVVRLEPMDTRDRQDRINALMRRAARRGKSVVRLKGGDPLVFGRAHGEVAELLEDGLPVAVVPGLSAALAGPAAAGCPLTWRGQERSFAVATARRETGAINGPLPQADTLVFLMAVEVLEELVEELIQNGHPPHTPAAVLERVEQPWERHVEAHLGAIAVQARRAGVSSPALLIVGEAVRPAHRLRTGPLMLFTGLRPDRFRSLGRLLHWPALRVREIRPEPDVVDLCLGELRAGRIGWVLFTSPTGVPCFFKLLHGRGQDARLLGGSRVGVAGTGTAAELADHGISADLVPRAGGSRGMLRALAEAPSSKVLLVQGRQATDQLASGLRGRGHRVLRLHLHDVVPHPELGRPLPEHEVAYFTSPSGVRAYWQAYGPDAFVKEVWSIGPLTARRLREVGIDSKVVTPHVSRNQNETVPEERAPSPGR